METILKFFTLIFTMFGYGTVYFFTFLFWSTVIAYILNMYGYYVISIVEKDAKGTQKEKT